MSKTVNIAILTPDDVQQLEKNQKFRTDYYVIYPNDAAKMICSTIRGLSDLMKNGGFPRICRIGFHEKRGRIVERKGFLVLNVIRWAVQNNLPIDLEANFMDFEDYAKNISETYRKYGVFN